MSVVTAQMVKELREMTGAGMSDCKKALDSSAGDLDKAVIFLREKGLAAAAKKASRAASEGTVSAIIDQNQSAGFVFEVNCETDFVTRNDGFIDFVTALKKVVLEKEPSTLEEVLNLSLENGTVQDAVTSLIVKIGENIQVRRFECVKVSNSFVSSYVHAGGKIGVVVAFTGTNIQNHKSDSMLNDLAKDVALQIAAMKPQYLNDADIPKEYIAAEELVIKNKFLNQGKPEAAIAKIVPSSIKTWMKEICLSEQIFVKDETKTVKQYVQDIGSKLGIQDLKIASFASLELGQGVEKKQDDFAAEVAAQVASSLQH